MMIVAYGVILVIALQSSPSQALRECGENEYDKYSNCADLAGWCRSNDNIQKSCPISCKTCEVVEKEVLPCRDDENDVYSNCKELAGAGPCYGNIKKSCPISCKTCKIVEKEAPECGKEVMDMGNCASFWKPKGYCRSATAREKCKIACGHCKITAGGYCKLGYGHTMCKYEGKGAACNKIIFNKISAQGRRNLVDEHNKLRSKIALGQQAGQPAAANMNKVVWNKELAKIAQRWADQCVWDHDKFRSKRDGTQVGQNMARTGLSSTRKNKKEMEGQLTSFVNSWYNEVEDPGFNGAIEPFRFDYGSGHYSQVVWAETTEIGCGATYFEEVDGKFKYILVCNYKYGNMRDDSMYKQGKACSQCPEGRKCNNNEGLCY